MTKRKWERLYLTINESGRHIQYADINEDNYVCNVETNDEEAKHIVHCVNNFEPMLEALKEIKEQAILCMNTYETDKQFIYLTKLKQLSNIIIKNAEKHND